MQTLTIARGNARRAGMALAALCIGLLAACATPASKESPQAAPAAAQPAGTVPVPPAVAIARPSAAEVDIARKGLAKFISSTDARTREVLRTYPDLVTVTEPRPNSAIIPALSPQFAAKHQNNLEVAKQGDAELLLMGDSITDFWRNTEGAYAGKQVLDKNFGQWKIANYGIAGDTTQGVLFRLQDGEGAGIKPRAIMLMIGTNNTGRNSAAEIAEGIGAVVLSLQNHFPQAKILLLAVFPRGRANDPVRATIADINQRIQKLDDGNSVFYLDIGKGFLDAQGEIPRDVMSDSLHPSPKGYEIWAEAVREPLTALMAGRKPAGR